MSYAAKVENIRLEEELEIERARCDKLAKMLKDKWFGNASQYGFNDVDEALSEYERSRHSLVN